MRVWGKSRSAESPQPGEESLEVKLKTAAKSGRGAKKHLLGLPAAGSLAILM